jgi:hypothetical protein
MMYRYDIWQSRAARGSVEAVDTADAHRKIEEALASPDWTENGMVELDWSTEYPIVEIWEDE